MTKPFDAGTLTGAYFWVPRPQRGGVAWDLVTCHDLGVWDGVSHREFWPYVVALGVGFGAQFGLFLYLRKATVQLHQIHHGHHAQHVVATSGATSTAAMLACCAHYLTNVAPILGAVGLVTAIAQYQRELFWVGLAFNAAGLAYVGRQVYLVWMALNEGHKC